MDHRRLFFSLSGVVSDKCNAMHKELLMWGTISLVERASQGWALVSVLILRGIHLSEAEKEEEKSVWVASRTSKSICASGSAGLTGGRFFLCWAFQGLMSFTPASRCQSCDLLCTVLHAWHTTQETRCVILSGLEIASVISVRGTAPQSERQNRADRAHATGYTWKKKNTTSYAPGTYGCLFF